MPPGDALVARLRLNVLLAIVTEPPCRFEALMAPPEKTALLPTNVLWVTVPLIVNVLLPNRSIAPPVDDAALLLNVDVVTFTVSLCRSIAPPEFAELFAKVLLTTVRLAAGQPVHFSCPTAPPKAA